MLTVGSDHYENSFEMLLDLLNRLKSQKLPEKSYEPYP